MLLLSLLKRNSAFSLRCSCWVLIHVKYVVQSQNQGKLSCLFLPFPPFWHPLGAPPAQGTVRPGHLPGPGDATGDWKIEGTFPSPGNSDPGVTCSVCIFDGDLCGVAFMKDQKHRKAKETHCPLAWLGLCRLGCSRPVMLCMYFDTPCVQMYLPLGLEVGDCL